MEKIQLPISSEYVKDWNIHHALREIFQNAIDREKEGMQYKWGYSYDEKIEKLIISNQNTTLDIKTLLLGNSSKRDDDSMIGQFGEGYKLALLVLCRNGINVTIKTGKEEWTPALEYSEMFKADVLTIKIDRSAEEFQNLHFLIYIEPEILEQYKMCNLHLIDEYKKFEASNGEVLLDKKFSKRIYVEGLYICTMQEDFKYGYNFDAGMLDLDRDRNSARPWDVSYECRMLLSEYATKDKKPIVKMIENRNNDVDLIFDVLPSDLREDIGGSFAEDFIMKHGEYVHPVSSEYEKTEVLKKYDNIKTVIVPNKIKNEIVRSDIFQQNIERWDNLPPAKQPFQIVGDFVNDYSVVFENKTDFSEAFVDRIFEASKNWRLKH